MITKIDSLLKVTRKCQLSQLTTYQTTLPLLLLDSCLTLINKNISLSFLKGKTYLSSSEEEKSMITYSFPPFLTLLPQYHKK